MKKITLKIVGMHCTSCAMSIDGDLEDTEGITQANTNYAKQQTQVEFDEHQVTENDIVKIIQKTGYTAEIIS